MKFTRRIGFIVSAMLFVLFAGSAVFSQQKETKIRNAITAVNEELMKAFADGDGARVGAVYAENAQLLQPNGKTVSGRNAIGKYWQGTIDSGIKALKIQVLEIVEMKDKAATVGRYEIFDANNRQLDAGKYVVLWIQENGKWRLHRDIWNSDAPSK